MKYEPTEDGITHINAYSRGQTELGRLLSHFAHSSFHHPSYGRFSSIESFWYWLSTGKQHEHLRMLYGYQAKEEGKKLVRVEMDHIEFFRDIEKAIVSKINQNGYLYELFKASTLPITHYYVIGSPTNYKAIITPTTIWFEYFYTKLRKLIQRKMIGVEMRVIIAGSRDIEDYELIKPAVEQSNFNVGEVVSGVARGVDRLGMQFANDCHIPIKEFPADWTQFGKRAGHIRNEEMGRYADALVALSLNNSSGTQHMVKFMKSLNKPVYFVSINSNANGV